MDFTPSWSGQETSPPRVLQTAANMCFHFYFTRHVAYMLLMRGWPWNEQGLVNYYYSPWHRTSSAKTTQDRNHTDSGQMGAFFITSANQQLLLLLYLARYTTTFLLFFLSHLHVHSICTCRLLSVDVPVPCASSNYYYFLLLPLQMCSLPANYYYYYYYCLWYNLQKRLLSLKLHCS